MKQAYDTYYRGLSNDAGHPSITALNRHVIEDAAGEIKGFSFGPDVPDVGDTLFGLCAAAFYLVTYTNEMLAAPGVSAELEECAAEYKRLVREVAKAEPA